MVERPVFMFGTGRSGTTLTFELLSRHEQLAWPSNYTNRWPRFPQLAALSRMRDLPFTGDVTARRWRLLPKPVEAYRFDNFWTDRTFTSNGLLTEEDVTNSTHRRFRGAVATHGAAQGKPRFLHKHTGYARVRYLNAIFPDAVFLHIYRDGRAVANSMNEVGWWSGDLRTWWWGEMRPDYEEEYLASGREPIVLAGIVWKTLMNAIHEECDDFPSDRLMHVRYDDLVRDPHATMSQILEFSGLPPSAAIARELERVTVSNMDTKWRRDLSEQQQELLQRVVEADLRRFGFCD